MKRLVLLLGVIIFLTTCKKTDTTGTTPTGPSLNSNTIIVTNDVIKSSLISVDSAKLVFNATGTGTDKIKVGSILASDISKVAPDGFLRKVTAITTTNGNLICTTEQASLTDAINQADVQYTKTFTDNNIIGEDSSGIDISAQQRLTKVQNLSFDFSYKYVIYDADGNLQTTDDQVYIAGDMKIEPTFNFELKIKGSKVTKFLTSISIKNTNNIKAESKVILASLNKEVVLKTFELEPFTIDILGLPVPIAKQWIAIVIGVDGNLSARLTTGAQNVNTVDAGINYENNTWSTINTIDNSFAFQPLTFEGAAKVEPWLQIRYEIRPYGIKQSRIYIGARGSVIGEATLNSTGLYITTKWGVILSAKAQMEIWDRTVLDYDKIFYENEFPISQSQQTTGSTVTDIDGNVYNTVTIGTQNWMKENLNTSHYRNGDPIPQVTDSAQWLNLKTGAWCYYNNDPANKAIYGKLYNWYAVNDPRGLAPEGWHIPNDTEWSVIVNYLGGSTIAGGTMKSTSKLWNSPNIGATNSSGFTGLPGGYRFSSSVFAGIYGIWWSSSLASVAGTEEAWTHGLYFNVQAMAGGGISALAGNSVRCVKN